MEVQQHILKVYEQSLPGAPSLQPDKLGKSQFIQSIYPYIKDLLDHKFDHLLQIMYRIDVSEKEFALTLRLDQSNANPAKDIAGLIYDRLLLKAKIRIAYKNKDA